MIPADGARSSWRPTGSAVATISTTFRMLCLEFAADLRLAIARYGRWPMGREAVRLLEAAA
jgi:hypothetical protein